MSVSIPSVLNSLCQQQPADPAGPSGPARSAVLIAGFLVVASQVWTGTTLEWLFIAGGIVMLLAAAADASAGGGVQRALDGLIGLLGVWSIVQAIVFDGGDLKWFSFATAAALALLSTIGLLVHENSTERTVHELSVTGSDRIGAPLTH